MGVLEAQPKLVAHLSHVVAQIRPQIGSTLDGHLSPVAVHESAPHWAAT